MELIEYLQQKYQGAESFVENVILPVFGKENFESGHGLDAISDSSLQSMADRTGIKSIILIGTINVPFNNVSIFDITVKDSVQMNRNRVTIQKIVHRIIGTYSSAFMIFHYDDDVRWDWRFTYCYKGANNVEGTDNKRYTFLLGPSQTCKTAAINFQTLASKKDHLTKEDLEAAFDVEALNKEFFNKYKGFYEDFVEYITGKRYVKEKNKWVEKKIHEPHEQMYPAFGKEDKKVRDYIKKMMGRIVFLHFLQKKGWMGVPKGESWGKGDLQFMKHLYEKANDEQKDDFLDLMLEPLFVALDTNRADKDYLFDTKSSGVVKIPYLNGGLFTRDELDEIDTQFPREKFADFLEFLYQYNFTIDENDPSDAQVGIDPEMLGRIFENLLEDNKDKGAYYTPKEIVKYMCKESLKAYLQTDITDEQTRDKINEFVETYDVEKIGGETSELAIELDKRLKDVKICDPAIGSGAFPMGLLKELFYCRGAIENFDDAAAIKRHIIQNNIYGVDIERGAVDIARMRFWLSLIIDEKTPEPLPNFDYKFMKGNSLLSTFNGQYVNVDTKHVSSRSSIIDIRKEKILLSETQQHLFSAFGQEKLIDEVKVKQHILNIIQYQLESELNSDLMSTRYEQQDLFNDNNYTQNKKKAVQNFTPERQQLLDKCKELKRIIEDNNIPLEKRAALDIDFFDWEIMFNDVFSRPTKEGFDIVIGNPPYGAKYSDDVKQQYKAHYSTAKTIRGVQKGSLDTYTLFIELGYNLLKKNGRFAYIVPISLTSSDSLTGIHRILKEKCETIQISSYAVRPKPVFENAVVNTSILLFQKTGTPCRHLYSTKMYRRGNQFLKFRK